MFQPSLAFLSLSIPDAMKALGSFRTLEGLPNALSEGVIDTINALLDMFPDIAVEYYAGMNADKDFNHVAEAYRLLMPAVEALSYPLHTENGVILADTPVTETLSPAAGLDLLGESYIDSGHNPNEYEYDALHTLTERLLDEHPSLKASIDQRFDAGEPDFDFLAEVYRGIWEAKEAAAPVAELAMAA